MYASPFYSTIVFESNAFCFFNIVSEDREEGIVDTSFGYAVEQWTN